MGGGPGHRASHDRRGGHGWADARLEQPVQQRLGKLCGGLFGPFRARGGAGHLEEVIIPTWGYSMAFLNGVLGVPGAPAGLPPRAEGESVQDALQSLVAAAAADPGVRSVSSSI